MRDRTTRLILIAFTSFLVTFAPAFPQNFSVFFLAPQVLPSLQLSDVYSVIGYYLRHKAEVDEYLVERQNRATEVRQEVEKRFNPVGIRERLLARRNQQG